MTAVAVPAFEEGRYIQITAAAAQTRGDVVVLGQLIGIATKTVDSGATDQVIDLCGVYDIDKNTSTAFSEGDRVYWDVADDEANSDSANPFIGIAIETVLAAATKVQVLLMPQRLGDDEYTDANALAAAKAGMTLTHVVGIPDTAAGTDWDGVAWRAPAALTISKVYLADHTGIAADAANYTVIDLYNETQTETIADWSTLNSADGALTAKTFADVPIETGAGAIAAGDVITAGKADTGTGQASDGMCVVIEYTLD